MGVMFSRAASHLSRGICLVRCPLAAALLPALAIAFLPTTFAGEKIQESAPGSKPPPLGSGVRPIDPILERVLTPRNANPGSVQEMPSIPYAPQNRNTTDPALQKRWIREMDKRKNWLLENAAQINGQGGRRGNEGGASEDLPRFSDPGGAAGLGTGNRYFRATAERQRPARDEASNDPNLTDAEIESRANGGQTREEAARVVPFSTRREDPTGLSRRDQDRERTPLAREGGIFSNPLRPDDDANDARKTAISERAASLDRLLSGSAPAAAPGSAAPAAESPVTGLLGGPKLPPSRAQSFESLLTGVGSPAPAAGGIFGSPLANAPSAAQKSTLFAGPDRSPAGALAPAPPPQPARPATTRIEPRPPVLQLPKFGL